MANDCMECVEGHAVALGLCGDCLAGEPLGNVIQGIARLTAELDAARTAFAAAMEYVHESHHAEIVATLEAKGIDLDALASTPPDTEGQP